MNPLMLFTDGSAHAQSKTGYGAYLLVEEPTIDIETLKDSIHVKHFENTSSSKLEIQTLLWALHDSRLTGREIIVYTDSQNIIRLPGRRARLEQNEFQSKKNKQLKNTELYKEFYTLYDEMKFKLVKVRGHKVSHQKDDIDRLFTLVDRAARNALRDH